MSPSRPLIIPHKRALLPPKTITKYNNIPIPKTLNTNTTPPETHLTPPKTTQPSHQTEPTDQSKSIQITEFPFASYAQPFLDPPTWTAMTKRRARTPLFIPRGRGEGISVAAQARAVRGGDGRVPSAPETVDQLRSTHDSEREAEFGGMAIRERARARARVGRRGVRIVRRRGRW